MKELLEYRIKLIVRLGEVAREFRAACEEIQNPFAKMDDGWTLHQIASHTRDTEKLVYAARIEQTLNENNPEFKNFDGDEWMAAHYDQNEALPKILDEFIETVDAVCKLLRNIPQEAWSRLSRHETQGGELTLQLWAERSMAHIVEHLQTLKKA